MSIAGELKRKRSEEYRNMKQSGGLGGGVRSVQGKTGHVEINSAEIPLSDTINITVHDSIMALRRDLESKAEQSEIDTINNRFDDYYTKSEVTNRTGYLDNLETSNKSNLVSAINEVNSKSGGSSIDVDSGQFYPELAFGGETRGIRYNIQEGRYYKIGDLVHFSIDIKLSSKGSSEGEATIEGMPFRNRGMTRSYVLPVVEYLQVSSDQDWVQPSLEFPANSDYMNFKVNNHNSRRWPRTDANFSNNTRIQVEGTYII